MGDRDLRLCPGLLDFWNGNMINDKHFFHKGPKKFHMCVEKYLVPDAQAQVYP